MSRAFNDYLVALSSAVVRQDGAQLKELLNINNSNVLQAVSEKARSQPSWNPAATVRQQLRQSLSGTPWEELFPALVAALAALLERKPGEAYTHLVASVQPFIKAFREDTDAWLIPPMYVMVHNVRQVACQADDDAARLGRKSDALENCGTQLQKCFAVAVQGAGNKSKKLATLEIIITLFKVYFRLNTLRLCKNLINAVNSRQFLPFDVFPASQRVTYKYYTGRLAIFDENYDVAANDLAYAFEHCHRSAVANKARCAYYLIPVKMLLGELPEQAMLDKFSLHDYSPIVKAMKEGSVEDLDRCLQEHQIRFIQAGTYLLLEKLKNSVYRRLFRRVALLHKEQEPAKAAQVPLAKFQTALAWQGVDMEMDEVECIVANLIYRKFVKGYISHQHRVAVLSKADPFPALSTATLTDP
ncbi:hypothetical protein WJX75_002119 [Coccomyxa subellipsoidea]|uniref:PCI domain-containing protein n=1 Tax=Coccomyxa subellipsoidea TaxID=248742 RepID=A0ABR2YCY7_9CHLO